MIMKQQMLCLAVLCLPFMAFSQVALRHAQADAAKADDSNVSVEYRAGSGVNWVEGLSWKQVKAKAKNENKHIFVDCFTTWCKPCAEMDQKVYAVDSVGQYLNAGFIS